MLGSKNSYFALFCKGTFASVRVRQTFGTNRFPLAVGDKVAKIQLFIGHVTDFSLWRILKKGAPKNNRERKIKIVNRNVQALQIGMRPAGCPRIGNGIGGVFVDMQLRPSEPMLSPFRGTQKDPAHFFCF